MIRFAAKFVVVIFLSVLAAAALGLWRSPDAFYTIQEWLNPTRFHRYDAVITSIAHKHGIDPMLIKAIVWRESTFHPGKVGRDGERGLMQVSPAAAGDWARVRKVETFAISDLFDPKTNLDAGTWYFKQALQHWEAKDDPITFALAEYNAGKKRSERWAGVADTAKDFRRKISFPGTRAYVEGIESRYRFYKARGRM
jgi:soluble lytic murein transglycosylase